MNMTVSIGMPVYNGAKYLREALDSLLAQSYRDFELIISDNASTDATEAICREYAEKDARIKYVRQSANFGAAANFRFVLNNASGHYFMWAACDDRWSPDWIQSMYQTIQDTNAMMAFGKVVHIDESGSVIWHPANDATFSYVGGALARRVHFYLDLEAMGKANVIGCLYDLAMRAELDSMLDECITGECQFDYTLIYNSLKCGELVRAGSGTIYKRIRGDSEGASGKPEQSGSSLMLQWIARNGWPLLPGLIEDYLRHSSLLERVALILLLPIKLIAAYAFGIKKIISRLRKPRKGR